MNAQSEPHEGETHPEDKWKEPPNARVQLVYDYAKFHIGLYTGVLGGLVAWVELGHTSTLESELLLRECF